MGTLVVPQARHWTIDSRRILGLASDWDNLPRIPCCDRNLRVPRLREAVRLGRTRDLNSESSNPRRTRVVVLLPLVLMEAIRSPGKGASFQNQIPVRPCRPTNSMDQASE